MKSGISNLRWSVAWFLPGGTYRLIIKYQILPPWITTHTIYKSHEIDTSNLIITISITTYYCTILHRLNGSTCHIALVDLELGFFARSIPSCHSFSFAFLNNSLSPCCASFVSEHLVHSCQNVSTDGLASPLEGV
jgi:hypothetical protein